MQAQLTPQFVSAQCPNCSGALQLPTDRFSVKCMYCSSEIIVQSATGPSTSNWMMLADTAAECGNSAEAYNYYTKVLEHDPRNAAAWAGKGEAAGWQSNLLGLRMGEMLIAFQQAVVCSRPDDLPELRARIARVSVEIARGAYLLSLNHTVEFATVGNNYGEHLARSLEIMRVLLSVHLLAQEDPSLPEAVVSMCDSDLEGIAFESDGMLRRAYPPPAHKVALESIRGDAIGLVRNLRPEYEPDTPSLSGRGSASADIPIELALQAVPYILGFIVGLVVFVRMLHR